ncbi:TIGR03016 family PEP-CTERM system-associated outer membrane protein [Methyloversatilis sp. XJ19-13]|uniref:TIGR03016 family PEP-CTERM system-associated outer membrane protein n=1 Tax=Methyloversatilis sp. XJ19-13 TaxID=2963430 RepID=UPI00211C2E15|nr:TIGR03016 family PEP-CTERM system-associated outer membrane protein [Methyloversatilis sp. XJ19-13]MCQ9372899.1 TIGR03016 family PEP-CTERM system-associated outer membrane protein [Methyloversatilis sp. XJ19-13]
MALFAEVAHAENWRVTTALTSRVLVSDNVRVSAISPQSDTVMELNPQFTLTRRSPRLSLDATYRPRYIDYLDGTIDSRVAHDFNGTGSWEAIDDLFFLNATAISAQRSQSVFNAVPTDNQLAPDQLSRTRTYSLTPSFRGTVRLGDVATWRSNYNIVRSETSGATTANTLTSETFTGTLASTPAKIGWQVDVSTTKTSSDLSRSTDRKRVTGSLIYRPDTTIRLAARYGFEDTNFANQRNGDTYGFGATWNPTPRTSFSGDVDERPFSTTASLRASHRLPRLALSASYMRNLTTRAEQILAQNGVTDLAESLAQLEPFASEADPDQRLRMIETFLRDNGLQRFQTSLTPILSDRQFLQTRMQMTVVHTGVRNTVSLSFFRSESDSGIGGLGPISGDDFALSPVIRQIGWTASYSHRLTASSSINLSLTTSKSDGSSSSGIGSNRDVANATWTTRLGTRSSGSIGLRMTRATVTAGDVDENAVIATLTTRFN